MTIRPMCAVLFFAWAAAAVPARAAVYFVDGFENGQTGADAQTPSNWSAGAIGFNHSGSNYQWGHLALGASAPQGTVVGFSNIAVNPADAPNALTSLTRNLSQTVAGVGNIAANTNYTLTVAVGSPGSTGYNYNQAAHLEIEFFQTDGNHPVGEPVFATNATLPSNGSFTDLSATLTAADIAAGGYVGHQLLAELLISAPANSTGQVEKFQTRFDNVRQFATSSLIPEPTSMSLLGLSMASLLTRRRGSKK